MVHESAPPSGAARVNRVCDDPGVGTNARATTALLQRAVTHLPAGCLFTFAPLFGDKPMFNVSRVLIVAAR